MKRLTEEERLRIDDCVKAVEQRTGTQIATAIVPKSDNYPEIPWKAFALGVSIVALTRLLLAAFWPRWPAVSVLLADLTAILGGGAFLALLSIRVQSVGRLFLHHLRAEVETREHAEVMMLRRGMFATPGRSAVLIMVSLFEHQVVIVPDIGIASRLPAAALRRVIDAMVPLLRDGKACEALCVGINEVGALLAASGGAAASVDDAGLPDAVIEERQERDNHGA